MTRSSQVRVLKYYYVVLADEWSKAIKLDPSVSVFAFIKYYLKMLVIRGFDAESQSAERLHTIGLKSNFAVFFKALDEAIYY